MTDPQLGVDSVDQQMFLLDGHEVAFRPGDTILAAASRGGHYIPHLCWHPVLGTHGSCRLCTVRVNGRSAAACAMQAAVGLDVQSNTEELNAQRKTLLQMLFVEGNHFCPSCEKSGNCRLQATAYDLGMLSPHFEEFYPDRPVDASHPDLLLDLNRCILCGLCVRASQLLDGKHVFAIGGHGTQSHLLVNSPSGQLKDSAVAASDHAVDSCPVGVILHKRRGFAVPIGQRRFDLKPVSQQVEEDAP